MLDVDSRLTLSDRFSRIRRNYQAYQRLVDAGKGDWMRDDPYQIADWISIFTPIESGAWCDIRGAGLPLWPQIPVGPFFVDFGNPVARVALECDGRAYHDAQKDAERDRRLNSMGWTVYRAPGSRCIKVMREPWEIAAENDGEVPEGYAKRFSEQTMHGLMAKIAQCHFPEQVECASYA